MFFEEYGTLENNFIDIIFNFSPFSLKFRKSYSTKPLNKVFDLPIYLWKAALKISFAFD